MNDVAIKTATGPTILLHSGHYFDLLDPLGSRFTLNDIAEGLGKTCRFAGQCNQFYSVAQHSLHASFIVPGHLAWAALMHDAAEAFIGDVTRPLKSLLTEYKVIERRIEDVIDDRFALDGTCNHPLVKKADFRMLAAEQKYLMPPHDDHWACLAGIEPAGIEIIGWRAQDATSLWLQRASVLLGKDLAETSILEIIQ